MKIIKTKIEILTRKKDSKLEFNNNKERTISFTMQSVSHGNNETMYCNIKINIKRKVHCQFMLLLLSFYINIKTLKLVRKHEL